jgi:hypothetical protein
MKPINVEMQIVTVDYPVATSAAKNARLLIGTRRSIVILTMISFVPAMFKKCLRKVSEDRLH